MNRIEEMIKGMCPGGVEVLPLWKVTIWDKKFKGVNKSMQQRVIKYNYLLADDLEKSISKHGDIRILFTTERVEYAEEQKVKDYISEGEIVAIPWGGNPTVKYYKGRFITGDNRIATSVDTNILNNKYLYYWLSSNKEELELYYRGAGIKHPSMYSVLSMQIPLPPLPIQQEIVRILDSFTALQQNLEDELKLRQKQYEHYREKMLTFEDGEVEWKKLGEVAEIGTGSRNTQDGLQEGLYPFYTRGQEVLRMNTYDYNETAIITAGDGAGVGKTFHFVSGCYALHQRAYRFVPNVDIMVPQFLYYYIIHSFYSYIMRNSVVGSVPSVRKPMLEKYIIPVPPKETQLQITQTLSHFESLISNLKTEIELRKKQYEYYREKLLTF